MMRNVSLTGCCFVLLLCLPLRADMSDSVELSVARAGDKVEISFTASAARDVEVAVVDKDGRVVRHLVAGLLGDNPPPPLVKGLRQKLVWDGRDDAGAAAGTGPFVVRVRLGSTPKVQTIVGRDGNTLAAGVASMVCSPSGELFVLASDSFRGRSDMSVFDRNGKYLRTIMPYSADTPADRTESVGHLLVNGERLPIVFNGLSHCLSPMVNGIKPQNMAWNPKGYLVLASGIGTMADHGGLRHLLAMDPFGGAPQGVNFVGPQLRAGRDRSIGGEGEASTRWFDHIAVSPDGKSVYLTSWSDSRYWKNRNGVWRLSWSDPQAAALFLGADEPGDDATHFNDPEGLAVDKAGNLYVCDRGNDRIAVFSPDGKRLTAFAAPQPEQIAVHPGTGAIYVLSHQLPKDKRTVHPTTLLKFAAISGQAAPAKLAELSGLSISTIALDASADPAKVWVYGPVSKETPGPRLQLRAAVDAGDKFEVGPAVNNGNGLAEPMYVAGDTERNRVYVYQGSVKRIDLSDGAAREFTRGTDLALDRAGNVYVMDGYGTNSMSRYTPDGKPLPFASAGSNKIKVTPYRGYGPSLGLQGLAVRANGDIYVAGSSNYGTAGVYGGRINVYNPDGSLKKERIIDGMGYGECGLGVDAAGNLYVGVNLKPAGHPYPDGFNDKLPDKGWTWYRAERPIPWRYTYYNAYLFHWGGVLKFGPDGGAFYGQHPWNLARKDYGEPTVYDQLAKAPAGSISYRSAYLGYEVRVAGSQWYYQGAGIIPSSGDGLMPDPGCVCYNSHLTADEYGRTFAPDCFRFGVQMLDAAGNHIARIGSYGNADDSRKSLAFAWPSFVSVNGGRLYVSDQANRQIVVVDFDYAAQATCPVK
ncbi:MAG: hypothetical protein BIFFINMI_00709 [Phycisphaerae bacterium]|nr:hypothetical protein [Phycisphaerae bacterium]